MLPRYTAPTPLEYFASLVHSDAQFALLEAAASNAQDEYPELDVQQLLYDMDSLQARLQRRIAAGEVGGTHQARQGFTLAGQIALHGFALGLQ